MPRKKRLTQHSVVIDPASIKFEYGVIKSFAQYVKGEVIHNLDEVERIKRDGFFGNLFPVKAGTLSGDGSLLPRLAVRPIHHKNLTPFNAEKQEMLARGFEEASIFGIDVDAISSTVLRDQVRGALQGYALTENPLFVFELVRLYPSDISLPMPIQAFLRQLFAQTLRSAYSIAVDDPGAPTPEQAVTDVPAQLGLAGYSGVDNAFANFRTYYRDLRVAQAIDDAMADGMSLQKALGEAADIFHVSDQTARRCRKRFQRVIKRRV